MGHGFFLGFKGKATVILLVLNMMRGRSKKLKPLIFVWKKERNHKKLIAMNSVRLTAAAQFSSITKQIPITETELDAEYDKFIPMKHGQRQHRGTGSSAEKNKHTTLQGCFELFTKIGLGQNDVLIDFGCGLGSFVIGAVLFANCVAFGCDFAAKDCNIAKRVFSAVTMLIESEQPLRRPVFMSAPIEDLLDLFKLQQPDSRRRIFYAADC